MKYKPERICSHCRMYVEYYANIDSYVLCSDCCVVFIEEQITYEEAANIKNVVLDFIKESL